MKKQYMAGALVFGMSAALASMTALAYTREESTVRTGGTEVTVWSGTVDSDEETYLQGDLDYVSFNRYKTALDFDSASNMTASSVYHYGQQASDDETAAIGNGGVEGVSWDGANTLTLDNAKGTVITIEGPELRDLDQLNTYNDKLELQIDEDVPNLTYHDQFDNFVITSEDGTVESPHSKENSTAQDTVNINLVGDSSFSNLVLAGNVKVVFEGEGTLTLEAGSQEWDYNSRNNPEADPRTGMSENALASYPTIGFQGQLKGEEKSEMHMKPEPGKQIDRTVTDTYEYALPEIELAEGMTISEGGQICNTSQSDEDYLTFSSDKGLFDESRKTEKPEDAVLSAVVTVDGERTEVFYNEAKTAFYVKKAEEGGPMGGPGQGGPTGAPGQEAPDGAADGNPEGQTEAGTMPETEPEMAPAMAAETEPEAKTDMGSETEGGQPQAAGKPDGAGMPPTSEEVWYDVTDGITVYQPWESYVGENGKPAAKVVLTGQAQ